MSQIALSPNPAGTGTFTIEAPNSNTNRTLTLPDNSGTVQALNSWSFQESGTDLIFRYNGTPVFKITSAGAIVAKDNVTAYGTV